MRALSALLALIFVAIAVYTIITIANDGFGLFAVFFGDMADMEWPGQFNFDFMWFLVLSALWTAWRNDFSTTGFGLAVLAAFGGALFLSAYLLVLIRRGAADPVTLLIGEHRVRALNANAAT